MEKNRVSFETARRLKDFGYTQDWYNGCVLYDKNRELVVYNPCAPERDKYSITAPTLDEDTRWLRNDYKIDILPYRHAVGDGGHCDDKYHCAIVVPPMFFERCVEDKELSVAISNNETFDSFDDAVAESLSFALELLENKRNGWKSKWFKRAVSSLLNNQMK